MTEVGDAAAVAGKEFWQKISFLSNPDTKAKIDDFIKTLNDYAKVVEQRHQG